MGAERGLIRALTLSVVFVTLITNSRTMAALSLVTDRLDLKHCAAALLVYTLVKYIYRGFFSPVARQHIPGPPLARFTHLWTTLHFLGFRRIFAVEEAHRKYGPVVRIAPNYISINHPPALQVIYNERSFAKEKFYKGVQIQHTDKCVRQALELTTSVMTRLKDEDHRPYRRIVAMPWTPGNIARYEPELRDNAVDFIKRLEREGKDGASIDVLHTTRLYAMDILGLMIYGAWALLFLPLTHPGETWSIMKNPEGDHEVARLMRSINLIQGPRAVFADWLFRIFEHMPIAAVQKAFADEKALFEYSDVLYKKTAAELADVPLSQRPRETYAQRILSTPISVTGKLVDPKEANCELIAAFFAGNDTISTLVSYALYHLATHHDVQDKLFAELAAVNDDRHYVPTGSALDELPYFHGFFKESLRLYGSAPAHLPRVVPAGGFDVLGYKIPAGTSVAAQAWSIHHIDAIYPEPNEFKPERWADGGSQTMRDNLMPFGKGVRLCVGYHLASIEFKLVVAALARAFVITPAPNTTAATMRTVETCVDLPRGSDARSFLTRPVSERCDLIFTPRNS